MFVHILIHSAPALADYAAGDCPLAGYSVPDIRYGVLAGGAAPDAGVSGAAPRSSSRAPVFQRGRRLLLQKKVSWCGSGSGREIRNFMGKHGGSVSEIIDSGDDFDKKVLENQIIILKCGQSSYLTFIYYIFKFSNLRKHKKPVAATLPFTTYI
jgi:hypothetical protein